MKRAIILILLLGLLFSLTACYDERGYAYRHLQDQDVAGSLHTVGEMNNTTIKKESAGVFENLNNNLCNAQPHCCGKFTEQEIAFKDLELRAEVENNPELCEFLPDKDLIIDCPGENTYVYYSKTRCQSLFS